MSHSDWESVMSVRGGGWGGGWVSQRQRGSTDRCWDGLWFPLSPTSNLPVMPQQHDGPELCRGCETQRRAVSLKGLFDDVVCQMRCWAAASTSPIVTLRSTTAANLSDWFKSLFAFQHWSWNNVEGAAALHHSPVVDLCSFFEKSLYGKARFELKLE